MSTVLDVTIVALVAALKAHAGVASMVGTRVFDTIAPRDTAYPLISIDSPTEGAFDTFGRPGNTTAFLINLYDDREDKNTATLLALYRHVDNCLHNKKLTLTTGEAINGTVAFLSALPDPDGPMRAILRYEQVAHGAVA